ncbi:Alpha-L-fucosidase [Candidatus Ornithobacterium hominis]|uniref:alpha-L-fucosidase n=1 Tax=Candidatus Ornithobacterium hominis TaxID=2497989 RepID=UPI000E5BC72C|nr:alpha-L-fucosidase [Candidatus Ornithobacterium hominis]SZD72831.1 Alpha-L-fucosidase [Candidatus Ornithobacterium hominis]
MNKILTLLLIFTINQMSFSQSQENLSKEERLEWFKEAKLGIFIHWGLYAVDGIQESWGLWHQKISYGEYLKQHQGFTAQNYNPKDWAEIFKKTGARYAVLTTRHHDGFALWGTKLSRLNAVDYSPAKRDLVAPFAQALRNQGLKVGLYYSLTDWAHPDYKVPFPRPDLKKFYPQKNQNQLDSWQRFVKYYRGQLRELSSEINPDLWWFDGDWERSAEEWRAAGTKDSLLSWNPNVIINSRLQSYGDYATPEQGIPVVRPKGPWEFCMTMNDNWGYFPSDKNYKPIAQIIRTFVEVISKGGNLLLNIGPKADGTIAEPQIQRLNALGDWIRKHHEAVFDTQEGLPYGHFFGPTMVSKDKKSLYLCLFDEPKHYVLLKGLQTKVKGIEVVGSGQQLNFERNGGAAWNNIPGILRIEVPQKQNLDEYVTIIKISLEDELHLYRGHGNAVEMN